MTTTTIDTHTRELYAGTSLTKLRAEANYYRREAAQADNTTKRALAQADAELYEALIVDRLTTQRQRKATAGLHDRIRAANARFGVKPADDAKHKAAAERLRGSDK